MENFEEKFDKLMAREGLKHLNKPLKFIAKYHLPGDQFWQPMEFKTPEERDEWYNTVGKAIEEKEGGMIKYENKPSD